MERAQPWEAAARIRCGFRFWESPLRTFAKDNKDVSEKIDVKPGRTFAGFGFTIAISNLAETTGERRTC